MKVLVINFSPFPVDFRVDYADNSDYSEDETSPRRKLISLSKWAEESSEDSSEESGSEPEQSKPLERSDSMLVAKSSSTGKDSSVRPLWAATPAKAVQK